MDNANKIPTCKFRLALFFFSGTRVCEQTFKDRPAIEADHSKFRSYCTFSLSLSHSLPCHVLCSLNLCSLCAQRPPFLTYMLTMLYSFGENSRSIHFFLSPSLTWSCGERIFPTHCFSRIRILQSLCCMLFFSAGKKNGFS
jgi:hypothetical protein